MRGVATLFILVFALVVAQLIGAAVTEPLGEHVKDTEHVNDSVNGSSIIDSTYESQMKFVPLVVFFGMLIWALLWYIRKERFTGRRGRF